MACNNCWHHTYAAVDGCLLLVGEVGFDLVGVLFQVGRDRSGLIRRQPHPVGVCCQVLQFGVVEFHLQFDVVGVLPRRGCVDDGVGRFGELVGLGFSLKQIERCVGID